MLEKLKRITKATIPKVVHAAEAVGKSLAKSAKTAEKKIQSSMAGKLIGKAVAAVPAKVSKVGSIALKTAATVPKTIQADMKKVNIIREVGANVTQTTNSVNKNCTEIKKVESSQKNQRIFEKIQEVNKMFFTDLVKGTTGKGALLFWPNVVLQNELPGVYNPRIEAMSYLVKIRKAVVEEYPIINWKVDLYKNFKQKLNSSIEISGNQIYNKNIPFLSDNFGALTNCSDYQKNGNRTPLDNPLYRTINAALIISTPSLDCGVMSNTSIGMSKRLIDNTNIASCKGAYDRGFLIEGAGGMIDGLVSLAINPYDMAEGIVNIYKEPEKYIPVICNEIIDYVNDKIIHGSPEDRAKFKGRVDFEIITFLALSGLGKGSEAPEVLQKSTEAEKGVAEGGKIVEEFNETVKATEGLTTIGKLENAGKSFEKLIDKMRKFLKGEIGSEELLTEELGQAAKSKTGVSINKTEVISKEAGNVGKAEAFEGTGKYTGIGKTGKGIPQEKVSPDVLKQIELDSNAAYGYSPKKGTPYEKYDFTDIAKTNENRLIREEYLEQSKVIQNEIEEMTKVGASKQEIADKVVNMRNADKVKARAKMPPEDLAPIEQRNLKIYGNKIGPDAEWLFKKNKLKFPNKTDTEIWEYIIENSMKKDQVINTLLGIEH